MEGRAHSALCWRAVVRSKSPNLAFARVQNTHSTHTCSHSVGGAGEVRLRINVAAHWLWVNTG